MMAEANFFFFNLAAIAFPVNRYSLIPRGSTPDVSVGHTCTFIPSVDEGKGRILIVGGANPSGSFSHSHTINLGKTNIWVNCLEIPKLYLDQASVKSIGCEIVINGLIIIVFPLRLKLQLPVIIKMIQANINIRMTGVFTTSYW